MRGLGDGACGLECEQELGPSDPRLDQVGEGSIWPARIETCVGQEGHWENTKENSL